MASFYIPADGGPRALGWPLGSSVEEYESTSIPGPTGGPRSAEVHDAALRVLAVLFTSDHVRKMTDKGYPGGTEGGDFEPGGDPFPEYWSYQFNPDKDQATSYPISHTGGKKVSLVVVVSNEHSESIEASLGGAVKSDAADGMSFDAPQQAFEPGVTLVRVTSNRPLAKQIQKAQFTVTWEFAGPQIASSPSSAPKSFYAPSQTTTNEMFVTLGEPGFRDNEITYERMAHAVEKAGASKQTDPYLIVESLVHSLKLRFGEHSTSDAWFFARLPDTKLLIDCISQARYVAAILKTVGIQGKIEAVIVYARPKGIKYHVLVPDERIRLTAEPQASDFEVVEEPDPGGGIGALAGLKKPVIHHPSQPWHLMFVVHSRGVDYPNAFEGCVKFTPAGGKPKWYPAGTRYAGQKDPPHVLSETFNTLSWLNDDTDKPEQVVIRYK